MDKSTRQEQIKKVVEKYTTTHIEDNTFTFDDCSAYSIALDLSIDRSNVSRILNKLFTLNQLIKIEGRPTLYISREVVLKYYPSIKLPKIILKTDSITNYIHTSNVVNSNQLSQIVGMENDGSLYFAIQRLAPYFFLPPSKNVTILEIVGEKGTGKKFIVQSLFAIAHQQNIFKQAQSIYFCSAHYLKNDKNSIINQMHVEAFPIIYIDDINENTIDYITTFVHDISLKYKNHKLNQPLVFLAVYPSVILDTSNLIIPTKVKIPNLKERPKKEIFLLFLSLIIQFAKETNHALILHTDQVAKFIDYDYNLNCQELYQETYKFLAKNLYYSENNEETIDLNSQHLSHHFRPINNYSEPTKQLMSNLPEIIDISPNTSIQSFQDTYFSKSDQLYLSESIDQDFDVFEMFIKCTSSLNDFQFDSFDNIFEEKLKDSPLAKDPNILKLTCQILQEFVDNRISILKYKVNNKLKISRSTQNMFNVVQYYVQMKNHFKIMETEKFLIQSIIEQALEIVNDTKVPSLIICHHNNTSENYADKFNEYSHSHRFYSIDYTEQWETRPLKDFRNHVAHLIEMINRGKGMTLFVDSYPLTLLDSQLVLKLKIQLFSFSAVSAFALYTASQITNYDTFFSSSGYLMNQNKINSYLLKSTLNQKKDRDTDLTFFSSLFPSIDVTKTNEIFYKCLLFIAQNVQFELNNRIIVDFLFHANCMIDKTINSNRQYTKVETTDEDVSHIIKQSLSIQPKLSGLEFTDTEINILYNSIYENIPKNQQ